MRILLALVLAFAALWTGYWYIGASAKHAVLASWFKDRRSEGWTVAYSSFSVIGFPGRFDSRFLDLEVFDPVSDLGWITPRFDIYALSYQPNHIIAGFDRHQTLKFPLERVTVDNTSMRASVTFEPDTELAVRETLLRSEDVRIGGSSGWTASAQRFNFSSRATAGVAFAHDVVFDAASVTPTAAMRRALDPTGHMPETIDTLFLDMVLGFDRAWDRIAVETGTPEVTTITLNRMNLVWGRLGLRGSGTLAVAKSGEITGRINLEIRHWREVLDLLVTSGLFDQATAKTIAQGLALLTAGTKDPASLKVPLILRNGTMSLGPVPLGYAPYFVRR